MTRGCGVLCLIALGGCGTASTSSGANQHKTGTADAPTIEELQRQIRERDKRIADLTSQLDLLKQIDQDRHGRTQFRRPSATVTPIE